MKIDTAFNLLDRFFDTVSRLDFDGRLGRLVVSERRGPTSSYIDSSPRKIVSMWRILNIKINVDFTLNYRYTTIIVI